MTNGMSDEHFWPESTISRLLRVKGRPLAWFMRNSSCRQYCRRSGEQGGFSMIELLFVTIIVLILSAIAIPSMISSMRMAHLRGAASDFAGLLEQARINAIRDNRYYSTYILAAAGTGPQEAYVDMLPKVLTGASGNGGTSVVGASAGQPGDPLITIPSEVVQQPVASAPNTANLKSQLLPSTTPVTPTDTSATPATFGPRGLPCTPFALTGGSVCDSSGGPTAFWTFLQNTKSGTWQAVTITPAGRIKKWFYTGSVWSSL
jgi:prepilin-type N-terminal cleavage/methylation domain-containing protein